MATGRRTQLTRQIGEHLVAAELGRRGLIATPFAGNLPHFDVLAGDELGRFVPIQVKAINGPSWQFNVGQFLQVEVVEGVQHVRGLVQLPLPDLVCIFVLLRQPAADEFYVFRMRDLQAHFARTYQGGPRPRNPESMHCAIWPEELKEHRDKWQVVFDALSAVPTAAAASLDPSNHGIQPAASGGA